MQFEQNFGSLYGAEIFPRVEQNVLGAKNLLPMNLNAIKSINTGGSWNGNVYTLRGVDWTVNDDLSITANGTATGGNSTINILNSNFVVNDEIFTCCPIGGASNKYFARAYAGESTFRDDYGDGIVYNDPVTLTYIGCLITSGITVSNIIFKPMIRLASDPDATYVPYAMTNRELTEALVEDKYVPTIDTDNIDAGYGHIYHRIHGNANFVEGQLYTKQALAANAWYRVATLTKNKPNTTVSFVITTYSEKGIGYGRLLSSGAIEVFPCVALYLQGQVYFNFSY